MIAIVILNWNGKKDTLECLDSVEKLQGSERMTIVVDNGSTDDSASVISEKFPHVVLLRSDDNLGFSGGNNLGIRYALEKGASGILLLNNDTIVDPEMLTAFAQEDTAGILGAKLYCYHDRSRLDHLGGRWNCKTAQFDLVGKGADGKSFERGEEIDYVCGAALYAKREVFETVGLLEPKFFLFWEESDFCFRARRAGFRVRTCPEAKVWHKGSSSITGGKPQSSYFFWRNRLLWIERNCPPQEKWRLWVAILLPEIFTLFKRQVIKHLNVQMLRLFCPKKDRSEKELYLKRNGAALRGICHYFLRRFGPFSSFAIPSKVREVV